MMKNFLIFAIFVVIGFTAVAQKVIYTKNFEVTFEEKYKDFAPAAEQLMKNSSTIKVVVLSAEEYLALNQSKKTDSVSVFVPRVSLYVSFYYALDFFSEGDGSTLCTITEFTLQYFPGEVSKKFAILKAKFAS
jgi:hypothetical protein